MKVFKDANLKERLNVAAEAKAALLQRVKAMPNASHPAMIEKKAAREELAAARVARAAAKLRAEQDLKAQQEADKIEQADRAAQQDRTIADQEVARATEKKAERDARYAARKNRKA
jgi:hypothetical protein